MHRLSHIIILSIVFVFEVYSQSPHGEDLDLDCSVCHNSDTWQVNFKENNFDHGYTGFSLLGQHQITNCISCHTGLVFKAKATDCNSCHNDLHRESVGLDCSKCHDPASWIVQDINEIHQEGRFPLLGQHLNADCIQCHSGYTDLYFEPLDIDCYSCHENDYNSTSFPNHTETGFSTDCEVCHSITANNWSGVSIIHDFFPLTGGHQIQDCFACHDQGGNFSGLSSDCYSCHQQDYETVTDPDHIAGNFPTDCTQCHSISGWVPATIDHNLTAFPLTGRHVNVDCADCHTAGFSGTPIECYACHQSDYESVSDPDHVAGNFPTDCIQCHTTNGWEGAEFDHNNTEFALTGAHINVDCSACHSNGYSGTPTDCYSCHNDDYDTTTNPNHQAAGFPTTCEDCHSTSVWEPANFDHDGQYFPIYSGKHGGEWDQCSECHTVPNNFTLFSCIDCHEHRQSEMDPGHEGVEGYVYDSEACFSCHPTGEKEGAFDHSISEFPLTGAHNGLECIDCHQSGYINIPTECIACHQTDYNNSSNPDHQTLVLTTDCETCHNTNPDWQPALFPIHNQYYLLEGAHLQISNDCSSCHNGDYNNTTDLCFDCHQSNYNNAPEHINQNFPVDCEICHAVTIWSEIIFEHANTNFPLSGEHLNTECTNCHITGYTGTTTICSDCHQADYEQSLNPEHETLVLPIECQNCHSTNPNWQPALFPIHDQFYPLLGAHLQIADDCNACHNGDYNNNSELCFDCHQSNYNNAPEHINQSYPVDCEICHTFNNWSEIIFDHANTNFPLTGEHQNTDCSNCHESGFTGTTTICFDCHQTDYEQSTNPDHETLVISTDCEDCHTTNAGWEPALFPIHNQYYELIGAHSVIGESCNDCHNGDYNNTPNTCFGCHENEFIVTTDPPHQILNFLHDCLECHNQNAWSPANFNHNFYSLSGDHTSLNCNECHSQSNYSPQCMSCHLDDFQDKHDPGDPTDCWDCHTTFDWDTNNKSFQIEKFD
ncbi:hypothetical protein ACFLSS_03110 [Bacteroidota bacterium]